MLYLEYASKSLDSHLLRKFGSCKANAVMKMFRMLSLKFSEILTKILVIK